MTSEELGKWSRWLSDQCPEKTDAYHLGTEGVYSRAQCAGCMSHFKTVAADARAQAFEEAAQEAESRVAAYWGHDAPKAAAMDTFTGWLREAGSGRRDEKMPCLHCGGDHFSCAGDMAI